jgi:hypothetical protein
LWISACFEIHNPYPFTCRTGFSFAFFQQVKADFLNPVKLLSHRKPLHYLADPLPDRITISFADASEAMG